MCNKFAFTITLLICSAVAVFSAASPADDGKYRNYKNSGKYVPSDEGRYIPMSWPYIHQPDFRELGRYVHVHIPYDGGYGPYSGDYERYRHQFDPSGQYSDKFIVSNDDPFNNQFFDIPKPDVLLEYGFPNHAPKVKRSIATNANQENIPVNALPFEYIISGQETKNVLASQKPITTTTSQPRTRYNDEGKWRILRQEELKNQKKYDYLYLTENGIYAEEQARLVNENQEATGTSGQGYYQYTGDDGKLYKVEYTVGEQGFVPVGEHIPKVPIAIQKALDYVAAQEKAQNRS